MKARTIVFVAIILTFSACGVAAKNGVAAKIDARNDLEQSKIAYKQCLNENSNATDKCAAQKEVYRTDLQAYEALSRGIRNGPSISVEQSN